MPSPQFATVLLMLVLGATSNGFSQTKAPAKPAPAYDTPEQTKQKEHDLAVWTVNTQIAGHQRDPTFYVYVTKEYMEKVVAILQKRKPRPITYEDYENLETTDSDVSGQGQWFSETVLHLGLHYREMSRTSTDSIDLVTYRWQNPDGSSVVATFRNQRLVSKTQNGLK